MTRYINLETTVGTPVLHLVSSFFRLQVFQTIQLKNLLDQPMVLFISRLAFITLVFKINHFQYSQQQKNTPIECLIEHNFRCTVKIFHSICFSF